MRKQDDAVMEKYRKRLLAALASSDGPEWLKEARPTYDLETIVAVAVETLESVPALRQRVRDLQAERLPLVEECNMLATVVRAMVTMALAQPVVLTPAQDVRQCPTSPPRATKEGKICAR